MNILILSGSPRKGGNTDLPVEAFVKGLSPKHDVESVARMPSKEQLVRNVGLLADCFELSAGTKRCSFCPIYMKTEHCFAENGYLCPQKRTETHIFAE